MPPSTSAEVAAGFAVPVNGGVTAGLEADSTDIPLPRRQAGTSPQHLLVTLLGDYWNGRREHLPSAALVALVEEFDVGEVSARAALRRLARRGVLESSKVGRNTYYGLSASATRTIVQSSSRIVQLGAGEQSWDGVWTLATFSLPEEQRDLRHLLRSRLRWLGFAPLFDGVWVSPRASTDEVREFLDELEISSAAVLRAEQAVGTPLISAWDLGEIRHAYDAFLADTSPLRERLDGGDVGSAEALIARTRLMDVWRTFPALDPDLPEEVLPADWPRRRARAVFGELYDALGPLAEARVRQVLARFDATLAPLVAHHTTADLSAAR
ncbi:PaaX family transcriptional regulator [Cryptosporangium aurantiacum]|uniref:Transcriptional regulator, PaaX family n=1 Tax=Cryptosporangium aurantiacum TaxID=134849 RepID=A0A1M7R6M9_9ACTN|nr:PaaX family transcriptional regulator C-terminal domain-containing protein [Cryptosporangium aurantiacum]SHN41896.1 transcriptional regulator, PaaX family [Cryptosporangium aurantiacum]